MIGAIAGDIVGSAFEGSNIKTKNFELFSPGCCFTDDTILSVALADTILTGTSYEANLRRYYLRYPDAAYGGRFDYWAQHPNQGPYYSWGNGAAMRINPVGFAFDDLPTVLAKAEEFTRITHNHPEGIKGAQATAACIFLARTGAGKDEITAYVQDNFSYDLSRTVDEIRPGFTFDLSCQGTVPQAVRAFIDSTDFEDALRTAVSLGGDTDTMACITGGIAQAFYKRIPEEIQAKVYGLLDKPLAGRTYEFTKRFGALQNMHHPVIED